MIIVKENVKLKFDFSHVVAIEDRLVCRPMIIHGMTEGGIIIPEKTKQEFIPMEVFRKGPDVKYTEIGDYVLIRPTAGVFFGSSLEDTYVIIRQSEILTYLPKDTALPIDNPTQDEVKEEVDKERANPLSNLILTGNGGEA